MMTMLMSTSIILVAIYPILLSEQTNKWTRHRHHDAAAVLHRVVHVRDCVCVEQCGKGRQRGREECSWRGLRTVARNDHDYVHFRPPVVLFNMSTLCCWCTGDGRIQHRAMATLRDLSKKMYEMLSYRIDNCLLPTIFFFFFFSKSKPFYTVWVVKFISGCETLSWICMNIYPYKAIFGMWLGIRVDDPIYM